MTLVAQRTITGEEVRPNVQMDRRRRRLSTIVARQADRSRPFIVSVHRKGQPVAANDLDVVLRSEMKQRLVGPEDIVLITYLPHGGGGKGGSILMAIAAIALAIIVPFALGAIGGPFAAAGGGLSFLGKAVATGITMGAMALMSQAMKPKANKTEETKPVYGVSGGGNLPRPGDRIPRLYGRCWQVPDLSQPDFFEYDGEKQILYKKMTISAGRARIHAARVNGQIMWTRENGWRRPFEGCSIEELAPGELSQLVPRAIITSAGVQGNELARPDSQVGQWSGPFIVSEPGVDIHRIQLDISAPQGLMHNFSNSKGSQEGPAQVGWEFQYVEVNDSDNTVGSWKTLDSWTAQILSRRPMRWTRRFTVPVGRYAVRGRNVYTNTPYNERTSNISNALQWDALRGHVPGTDRRQNVTEVALRIESSAALGVTSFANVEIEAAAVVPVWNGSAWVEQETSKAIWAFADIMRNQVYGGGLPDSAIDKDTLKFYADNLTQYDTFDGVIRGPDSVWNAASTVLFPMRAEPVQLGRVWSVVRDAPTNVRPQVITSRQIVGGSSGISFDLDPDNGEADIIAEYNERADPRRSVPVPRIRYGNPSLTPTRRAIFGVRRYGHAVHLARWLAAAAFYRRQTVQFQTEYDGRLYKRGDSISVQIWFAHNSRAASVVDRSGDFLTLDRSVPAQNGDYVILRDRSGREWGPVLVWQSADTRQIILEPTTRAAAEASTGISLGNALALDTMEETTVLIGPISTITRNYLVRSAKPSGRDRVEIEAVIDRQEVWDAIGATIEPSPYGDTDPDIVIGAPTSITYSERLFREGDVIRSALTVSWQRSDARGLVTEVEYRIVPGVAPVVSGVDPSVVIEPSATDGLWQVAGSTGGLSIEIADLPACFVDVRMRAVYSAQNASAWTELRNIPVLGVWVAPADVAGMTASVLGDVMTLTWDAVRDVHLSHYEVRFSPNLSGVEWGAAIPLVSKTTVTTVRVPAAVGTYLVKAVSVQGIVSRNAALVVSDVAGIATLNAIETLVAHPGFTGIKTQTIVNSSLGGLQLDYSDNVFARSNWFFDGDFFLGFSTGGGLAGEGSYTLPETVDLGAVFTSRLTAVVDAVGLDLTDNLFAWSDVFDREDFFMTEPASTWDARLEYRATNDNPAGTPAWTDWKQVIIGDVTARAYQFRIRLMSYQFGVTPLVTRLEVQVDMPDRHEGGNDLAVPTAGLRVNFSPPFMGLKGLGITAQNMASGDRYAITSKSPTGFNIQFFNSGGAAVAKTFDFVAVGYGRKET